MAFFQNLVHEDPSAEQRSEESPTSSRSRLQKQLSFLSVGSGILGFEPEEAAENRGSVSDDAATKSDKEAPKLKMGSPPKVNSCVLPGAFFSASSSRKETLVSDMPASAEKPEEVSPVDSPLVSATRSRNGSGASQRYVPPKGKYSSEQPRDSDQHRFREWLSWDNDELEKRKRALIGKTVVGKLSPKRGNRYFVKWNINANDTIVISSDKVEEILGDTPPAGMWVSCTIVGLGPGHVQWNKQHPYAMTLESRETRASHQPGKGIMPRGSPHWKKAQKAGLTREVTDDTDQRRTVPAEIDMARYQNARSAQQIPASIALTRNASAPVIVAPKVRMVMPLPMAPPTALPKGAILAQTVPHPAVQTASLGTRTNGANINLVTGEVRQRGRADTGGSWRRDRSFTV
jgi:hypothetical protein